MLYLAQARIFLPSTRAKFDPALCNPAGKEFQDPHQYGWPTNWLERISAAQALWKKLRVQEISNMLYKQIRLPPPPISTTSKNLNEIDLINATSNAVLGSGIPVIYISKSASYKLLKFFAQTQVLLLYLLFRIR